jgi:hypothetical protein
VRVGVVVHLQRDAVLLGHDLPELVGRAAQRLPRVVVQLGRLGVRTGLVVR